LFLFRLVLVVVGGVPRAQWAASLTIFEFVRVSGPLGKRKFEREKTEEIRENGEEREERVERIEPQGRGFSGRPHHIEEVTASL
jgi:hypothetical protein